VHPDLPQHRLLVLTLLVVLLPRPLVACMLWFFIMLWFII